MLETIKNGKADGIICWKLNRLSRCPYEIGEIQGLLQEGIIKTIITPSREYLPTDNVLMMAVEFGMANQFILDLSKDVKRGMKTKAEKGWRPHMAPIGYINDKYGLKGDKKIFKDPNKYDLVRKMWDLMLTGNYSVPQIVKIVNEDWGLRNKKGGDITTSGAYHMFRNTFYYGEFEKNGVTYMGNHPYMVTHEEFDIVQAVLGKRGKPRPKNKRLPFTGFIRCPECDSMVTAEETFKKIKSTGKIKKYLYMHCTKKKGKGCCQQRSIEYNQMIEQIKKILHSITIPEDFLHWALGVLKENNEIEENNRNKIMKNLHHEYERNVKCMDNLINLYVSPENAAKNLLNESEYINQKNILVKKKANLETQIRKTEKRVDDWIELTEKSFKFATYAKYWFDKGTYEDQTAILKTLGCKFYLKDRKLHINLEAPFVALNEEENALKISEMSINLKHNKKQQLLNLWSG
jgi:site-specific DNA recombinase